MEDALEQKMALLRSDYETIAGRPVSRFFCPILFLDEKVDLCKAHIVNRAFPESSRDWTIQRKDVDNFFGSVFESDFVDVRYLGKDIPQDVVGNRELSRKLRPKIRVAGETVPHFVANGPVPGHFTEAVINSSTGPVRLGLKIHPDDMPAAASRGCEVVIEKDIRLPALVSLLKAAHLTLFQMLGYRYALSAGGHFLGRTVLGDFFLANRDNPRQKVLENARSHFLEFVNMARPVLTAPTESQGTLSDGFVFVCRCDDDAPWAFIVFIRTSNSLHAVVVPILESQSAAARFISFLRTPGCTIRANRCRFEHDKWLGAKDSEPLVWPKADLE